MQSVVCDWFVHIAKKEVCVDNGPSGCVTICPKTNASSMYYKTKLQLHNFRPTLHNLKSKDGYYYFWCETEGDLSGDVFAYLQYKHFDKILSDSPEIKELVVWSDGYGYQNRNAIVANMYSSLARKHGVTIYQKYLVPSYTLKNSLLSVGSKEC